MTNSSMGFFIINFMCDDEARREIRKRVHKEQIDWLLEHTNLPITVVAMNYREEDFIKDPRITYVVKEKLPVSKARNVAFETFYASDFDYGVFLDDDIVLYTGTEEKYNSGHRFFEEMNSHIKDYYGIDIITPIHPNIEPFRALWKEDPDFENYHVFKPCPNLIGQFFIMKNFRKFGTKELFADETFEICEDQDLVMNAIASGYKSYKCQNIVCKNIPHKESHFWEGGQNSTKTDSEKLDIVRHMGRMVEKYGDEGLVANDKGWLKFTGMMKQCWPDKKTVKIIKTEGHRDQDIKSQLFEF